VPDGADGAPVARQESGDEQVIFVRNAERPGLLDQCVQDRLAGSVPDEAGTPIGLGAEEALVDPPTPGPVERAPPVGKLPDAVGRVPDEEFHGAGSQTK
jgi:hypothetical protein